MTDLANVVQSKVQMTYGLFTAGQIASTVPHFVSSARYADQSAAGSSHPLKYGFGCGRSGFDASHSGSYNQLQPDESQSYAGTGGATVSQSIERDVAFVLAADLNTSVTAIAYDQTQATTDLARNPIRSGDYILIGTEVMYVRGIDNASGNLAVVRGQKGTTAAAHTAADEVFKLSGTSNFAGVIYRDLTVPGRFNSSELDARMANEIVTVFEEGDIVCVFGEAVAGSDLNKPVYIVGGDKDTANLGRFTTNEQNSTGGVPNIMIPNSRIISQSERVGSVREADAGNSDIYLAVVRFTR